MFVKLVILLFVTSAFCRVEFQITSEQKYRIIFSSDTPEKQEQSKIGDCSFNICKNTTNSPEENITNMIKKIKEVQSSFENVIEPIKPVQLENNSATLTTNSQKINITNMMKKNKDVQSSSGNVIEPTKPVQLENSSDALTTNSSKMNITNMLKKNKDVQSSSGNVIEPTKPVQLENNSAPDYYEPPCKSVYQTVFPKTMRDVGGVQRIIVNVDAIQQIAKIEICDSSQGKQCSEGSSSNRNATCVQMFQVIELLTVISDKNTLEYRTFNIPTSCACTDKN